MPKKPNIRALFEKSSEPSTAGRSPLQVLLRKDAERRFINVNLSTLMPNPKQPRQHFDEESLQGLTDTVRQYGVIEPIVVYKTPDAPGYTIIGGERRTRAAKAAGLTQIPAIVYPSEHAYEIAVVENVQRENLTALEEAESWQALKELKGYTDEQVAQKLGKSRKAVNEALLLTDLPDPIKREIHEMANVRHFSKMQLLQVLRAGSPEKIRSSWNALLTGEVSTVRELKERRAPSPAQQRTPWKKRYPHPDGRFAITVSFRKQSVTTADIRSALQWVENELL